MFGPENKIFWDAFRQALLMIVDAIERGRGISPTTAEIRATYKLHTMQRMQK